MSFFRIGDQGIILAAGSAALSLSFAASPPVPPPLGLSPVMVAEYVDTSGVLQRATSGVGVVPTITGVAPFRVWFDAADSRSALATTEGLAWTGMGYRFDMGENLPGVWSLSGLSRNRYEGASVIGHVFETTGTHTVTLTVRDGAGRQGSILMNVVVTAPGAGSTINPGTSWPTFVNGGVYNLVAGGNYTSMGDLSLSGLHGVLIRKTGSGADPIVSGVNWDNRGVSNTVLQRTRNCRLLGIDVASLSDGLSGSLYCSAVNGRVRRYSGSPSAWYWSNQSSTQNEKNNLRRVRGLAFWNTGEMNSSGDSYVFIGEQKNLTVRNVDMNKTTGNAGQHVFRGWFDGLDLRSNRFRSQSGVQTMSYNKIQGADNGSTFDPWHEDDRIGVWGGSLYRPVSRKIVIEGNIYGASGAYNSVGTNIEVMPENNDTAPAQAIEMASVANNRWFVSSWAGMNVSFDGRHMVYSNNRLNMGAGGEAPYSTGARTNRIPTGWNGPYVNAARPAIVG